ncbi:LTA synthase family protein [Peribacillus sp. SCS-37]|uniref:LTA synthase family protein n=1 Tax=Paraperibacillus esterisolvens TaxID=3115296 RepID=UPI003905A640
MKERRGIWLFGILTFTSMSGKSIYSQTSILNGFHLAGTVSEIAFIFLSVLLIMFFGGRAAFLLLISFNALFTLITVGSLLYYDYYGAILTYKSLSEFNQAAAISDSIFALVKKEYIFLAADFAFLPFLPLLIRKAGIMGMRNKKLPVLSAVSAILFISAGMLQAAGSISEIGKYSRTGLIGYQFLEAGSGLMDHFRGEYIINAETLKERRSADGLSERSYEASARGKNLIIIQLESVQNFFVGLKAFGQEVTPNLNNLAKNSFYFPHIYTQVGKGNTSDAEFVVNTSIYALGDVPMSSAAEGIKVPGLPRELGKKNYRTATFHANSVSFWNREEMYKSLGFDSFYDKRYFGDDDVISYGTSDEQMYLKTAEKLSQFKEEGKPFYAHVIALSSHFPYKLPAEKLKYSFRLPSKFKNTLSGSYLEAVSYADYALGGFFSELKARGLYDESVIIVYGDHQGLQIKNKKDKELAGILFGRGYDEVLDHLNIPLLIKVPGIGTGKKVPLSGGLVDIYPTAANLLGISLGKEMIFGRDLLNSSANEVGIRFYAPEGTYITNQHAFKPGMDASSGKITKIRDRSSHPASAPDLKKMKSIQHFLKQSDSYMKSLKDGK